MNPHILVIDDNAEMADNIASILQLARYRVTLALNGKEGVRIASRVHPDLVICDILMPELDGYGVFHILRSDPETADIPIIFLSAKSSLQDMREGMNLGADDYLTKPFETNDLLRAVEVRLRKRGMPTTVVNSAEGVAEFFSKAREMKEFEKLSENRPVRTFHKKDVIFMEGQAPNELYYIEKGAVKTYKVNEEGKELITAIHHEGNFLGYLPLLEESTCNETAEALETSRIMLIPKTDFIHLLYNSKEVAHKFIKMLSNNLDEVENRLMTLAYQPVRKRVAGELLHALTLASASHGDLITVSRRDMANIVGTATESLNRTLSDFRDEGLIDMHHEGIRILNKPGLERLMHA